MATIPYEAPVLNEEIWNAWLAKTNRQEQASMRTMRIVMVIVIAMAAIGFAMYRYAL